MQCIKEFFLVNQPRRVGNRLLRSLIFSNVDIAIAELIFCKGIVVTGTRRINLALYSVDCAHPVVF